MSLLRNLLLEYAQVEIFACRDGKLDDLCEHIDVADIVFCCFFEDSNMATVIRYAEEKGKEILHLKPSEDDFSFIREKQKKKSIPYPGVYLID